MTTVWNYTSSKQRAALSTMFVRYNPNPEGRSTGDCAVRALSKALDQTWDQTYVGLCAEGFHRKDWGNADSVWGPYLKRHGFRRYLIPDTCPDCYTVADFATENPYGTFILSIPGRHVVTVVNGDIFDSWDSSREVPSYFWAKKEGAKTW